MLSGGLSTKGHKPSEMARQQIHDIMLEISGPCMKNEIILYLLIIIIIIEKRFNIFLLAVSDVHHSFVQRWNEASDRQNIDGCWPNAVCFYYIIIIYLLLLLFFLFILVC